MGSLIGKNLCAESCKIRMSLGLGLTPVCQMDCYQDRVQALGKVFLCLEKGQEDTNLAGAIPFRVERD